jgi:cysteine desulfurase
MWSVSPAHVLYFDHNATSPLSAVARQAWLEATERFIGNPSSPHRVGARAEAALSNARERLAEIIGCAAHEVIFTSGATEAANTVVHHLAHGTSGVALVSAIEHPAVLAPVRRYFADRHQLIPVTSSGVIDLTWLEMELRESRPAFVAMMAANNETGVLQPWVEVQQLCASQEVPFLCDAAQWCGKMPAAGLGRYGFALGCAHKFGGPAGVGFLKVPERLRPLILGGEQEDGQRSGTENLAGVLALVAAVEEREEMLSTLDQRLSTRRAFEAELTMRIPEVQVIGAGSERLWNTVSVVMPELDCRHRWVVKLDKLGFAVSTGSACASGKEKASHVLHAMGFTDSQAARALRFSGGWDTPSGAWSELLDGLERAVEEVQAAGSR